MLRGFRTLLQFGPLLQAAHSKSLKCKRITPLAQTLLPIDQQDGYWPGDRGDNHELVNEQRIDAPPGRRFENQQVSAVGSVSDCVDRRPVLRIRFAFIVARAAMRRASSGRILSLTGAL